MSKTKQSTRYKGLTRISATFTALELNDLKEVAQHHNISASLLVSLGIANFLADNGKKIMLDRVALLAINPSRKGIGGGNNRKPVKKVTQRKKGVKVVVQGAKSEINQIEMEGKGFDV